MRRGRLHQIQHAPFRDVMAIHRQNTTVRRLSYTAASGPMPRAHLAQRSGPPILRLVPETTSQICVRVRLFASYREAAGTNRLEAPLPHGARVSDLIELLAVELPALKKAPG